MIWPTSMLICGLRVHRLGELQRGRRELLRPLGAVGVELDVRQVRRQALERVDGLERRARCCRPRRGCCRGCAAGAARRARAARAPACARTWRGVTCQCTCCSSTSSLRWLNLKAEMPPGLTTFTPIALAGVDGPARCSRGSARSCSRRAALGQQLQEQLVVAEHHVGAVVEHRHVAHLHVGMARVGSAASPARRPRCSPSRRSGSRWPACRARSCRRRRVRAGWSGSAIGLAPSRWSSAISMRARLTLPPPMWVCMSMPPAITTQPLASISSSTASPAARRDDAAVAHGRGRARRRCRVVGSITRPPRSQQAAHAAPPRASAQGRCDAGRSATSATAGRPSLRTACSGISTMPSVRNTWPALPMPGVATGMNTAPGRRQRGGQRRVAEHDQSAARSAGGARLVLEARHPQQRIDGAVGQQARRIEAQRFVFQAARARRASAAAGPTARRTPGSRVAAPLPPPIHSAAARVVRFRLPTDLVHRLDDQRALRRQPRAARPTSTRIARRVQALRPAPRSAAGRRQRPLGRPARPAATRCRTGRRAAAMVSTCTPPAPAQRGSGLRRRPPARARPRAAAAPARRRCRSACRSAARRRVGKPPTKTIRSARVRTSASVVVNWPRSCSARRPCISASPAAGVADRAGGAGQRVERARAGHIGAQAAEQRLPARRQQPRRRLRSRRPAWQGWPSTSRRAAVGRLA